MKFASKIHIIPPLLISMLRIATLWPMEMMQCLDLTEKTLIVALKKQGDLKYLKEQKGYPLQT